MILPQNVPLNRSVNRKEGDLKVHLKLPLHSPVLTGAIIGDGDRN